MTRATLTAWVMIPLLLAGGAAGAADAEADKLREQLRATVLQLRELQDQQAAAAASRAGCAARQPGRRGAQGQARGGSGAAARGPAPGRRRAPRSKAAADKAQGRLRCAAGQDGRRSGRAGQVQDGLRAGLGRREPSSIAERDQLKAELATQTLVATTCQAKNTRLIAFAEGLIDAIDKITFGQKVAAREPLLGFTRVRLENLAQEREDTVRADRCDPRLDAKPPVAKPATPARRELSVTRPCARSR